MTRLARVRWLTLLFVVGTAVAVSAQSQITTGVIQGTVTDQTGSLVPGASVEARNLDTNLTRTLTTGADGRFSFLLLPPGRYRVTVTKAGFTTVVQENLTLTVGQTIDLDPKLAVSEVAETVTVTGSATVDTSRTELSNTLNENTVSTTPILGRKFEDLLTLTPGVSIVQGPDGDSITFVGQRGIFNNISLDGGDYNNGFFGEQVGGQRAAIDITLEAVKEFQVVATGANAEYGRTAGGVVNVITKSGTNDFHGSLFHFQRLAALTSNTSDGKELTGFHREQFGGTLGGPIKKDKMFFFAALERISGNFERANLSEPLGPACSVTSPVISNAGHERLINDSAECQRAALLSFFRTNRGQEEGLAIEHPISDTAVLLKWDWLVGPTHTLSASYNFNHTRKENETFDVATYGNSANGIEGAPGRINVLNLNFFSTVSPTRLNELHVTYSRETRPRLAVPSNVPADTAMGFATTFRFGQPFFLQPAVDELIWRVQLKDNFSIVAGSHTVKVGGEWLHTVNDQVFRGFFTGRYIFDSVAGFLRYASPAAAGGFGPRTIGCSNGSYVTAPASCPAGSTPTGGPLLLYLQGAALDGPATDATGASNISNEEIALFIQDKWQIRPNLTLNYGLRWEAQLFPETVDPRTTAYGAFLDDPRFPSDGTLPDQWGQFQPRLGLAWDVRNDQKSVVRANAGVYYARQNMLTQVGSVTTNGLQQQTIFVNTDLHRLFGAPTPSWPGVLVPSPLPAGQFPLFSGVRVFHRDYRNPRTLTLNVAYEQQLAPDWSAYVDFTVAKGQNLTRFLNYNVGQPVANQPASRDRTVYGPGPWDPQLGEVMVANSRGKSLYRGATVGLRKRFSRGFQLEANYVVSKDEDDDSNERDPFTDRSFNFYDLELDYALSDRDIRHRFNAYAYGELPLGLRGNVRVQARTAQPITPSPRVLGGVDRGRNSERKENEFFSLDWRLMRPIKLGGGRELVPIVEMFNTLNNTNNVNPLTTPALFNFDGFLRQGVGDPRQVQLAVKLTF